MQNIQAITFDLDDSLWAIVPVLMRAERTMYAHLERDFPEVTRRHDVEAMRLVRDQVAERHPHLAHDVTEMRRLTFAALLQACDYDCAHADDLMARFIDLRHQVELFDDVLPALERLAARYPLFAISNGNADLARLDLGRYFKGQVTPRSEGFCKPDARIFHAACMQLDLDPGDVLHIGDNPVDDVQGALGAGLKAAWLNRTGAAWTHHFEPHLTCSNLDELTTILLD